MYFSPRNCQILQHQHTCTCKNDNSKRRMHHTITWWNHLRDENNYLSNFRPFFFLEIHFIVFLYSTVLYINIICQTFTTQEIWNRYFPLCFMKKIHIFITKGKRQKTKENDTKFKKKKSKKHSLLCIAHLLFTVALV